MHLNIAQASPFSLLPAVSLLHWILNIHVRISTKDDDKPTTLIHRRYRSRLDGVEMGEGFATSTTSPGTYELASNWIGPINSTKPTRVDHLYSVEGAVW